MVPETSRNASVIIFLIVATAPQGSIVTVVYTVSTLFDFPFSPWLYTSIFTFTCLLLKDAILHRTQDELSQDVVVFFSFHHKPLGETNAPTLAYLWMLDASETVSSWGAPYLWSARKASLRLREPTPSLAIWRKARWCGVVSFPSVKVRTAEKSLTSVCLVRNKAQIKKESSCKSTAVGAVEPESRRIAGICPGLVLCLLTFVLLSVIHVNKDHICSTRLCSSLLTTFKGCCYERNWQREPKWLLLAEWEKHLWGLCRSKGRFSLTKQTLFIVRSGGFIVSGKISDCFCVVLTRSSTSLCVQPPAEVTTQGCLVSSFPRGGQATTKTRSVVSGSLRLSQETPSRSALTGLSDSSSTIELWKQNI